MRQLLLAIVVLLFAAPLFADTHIWRGDAPAVSQVDTLTVGGTVEIGDLFILTINGKSVSVAATSTSTATTATDIYTAWEALSATKYPEFQEATADDSGSTIIITADTAGKPFTLTVATTESNGGAADAQTFGTAATTASSGPYHWDTAANWSPAGPPASSDVVVIQNSSVPIRYGIDQNTVDLATMYIDQSYTGAIGLPVVNVDGTAYYEYRATYLKIGCSALRVGTGEGNGCGFLNIDGDGTTMNCDVVNTGTASDSNRPAFCLKGTALNAVNVNKGSVGIGWISGDTSTLTTLSVGNVDSTSDANVWVGRDTTYTTINTRNGVCDIAGTPSSAVVTVTGGSCTVGFSNTGTITSCTVDGGGTLIHNGTTITTLTVSGDGIADFSQELRTVTVTNCDIFKGATISDPRGRVTWTNGIDLNRCNNDEVSVDVGQHRRLTPGTPS